MWGTTTNQIAKKIVQSYSIFCDPHHVTAHELAEDNSIDIIIDASIGIQSINMLICFGEVFNFSLVVEK